MKNKVNTMVLPHKNNINRDVEADIVAEAEGEGEAEVEADAVP